MLYMIHLDFSLSLTLSLFLFLPFPSHSFSPSLLHYFFSLFSSFYFFSIFFSLYVYHNRMVFYFHSPAIPFVLCQKTPAAFAVVFYVLCVYKSFRPYTFDSFTYEVNCELGLDYLGEIRVNRLKYDCSKTKWSFPLDWRRKKSSDCLLFPVQFGVIYKNTLVH